jgi:hypothetical protein
LFATIHTQPKIPLAGLDPAIYVLLGFGNLGGQGVDARNKSGQGVFTVAPRLTPLDPTLSRFLNRTAFGLVPAMHEVVASSWPLTDIRPIAIQREHNMKHWPRSWKVRLILASNPDWDDLYDQLV